MKPERRKAQSIVRRLTAGCQIVKAFEASPGSRQPKVSGRLGGGHEASWYALFGHDLWDVIARSGRLPKGVTPLLGPGATGVGWVYECILVSDRHDLAQLRSIQDWFLRYELARAPGIAEVASVGGFVKQYRVIIDRNKLLAYSMPLKRVKTAVQRSNNGVGVRLVEIGETEFMGRGPGCIQGGGPTCSFRC